MTLCNVYIGLKGVGVKNQMADYLYCFAPRKMTSVYSCLILLIGKDKGDAKTIWKFMHKWIWMVAMHWCFKTSIKMACTALERKCSFTTQSWTSQTGNFLCRGRYSASPLNSILGNSVHFFDTDFPLNSKKVECLVLKSLARLRSAVTTYKSISLGEWMEFFFFKFLGKHWFYQFKLTSVAKEKYTMGNCCECFLCWTCFQNNSCQRPLN